MSNEIISINLVKSIPNKRIRKIAIDYLYGIIPPDGRQRSVLSILENSPRYAKMVESLESNRDIE